ncbi:Trafficking protein particle complex subunit 5 [Camelus dromedarius]|uniref:Trafficking protein particle complex subunit 5 n=2 Tax=Camelus dromedarius TaxID=9838 RepID=A0A5N4CMX9_CAMDR|nr:Trafficking protein particle complex subunit 5 [Camelus dromedarius]
METEEIYMNQVKMQAEAFKDKKRRSPDNKEGADDPAYENFTLTFRNRDQPKGSHSPAKNKVPSQSRPPLDSAQGLYSLHRAMVSLSLLLALSCVVLLALVLMKNSEMSQELLNLKGELQNVSLSAQGCLELQKEAWSTLNQSTRMAVQGINTLKNKVQEQSQKLLRAISETRAKLDEIEMLKMPNPRERQRSSLYPGKSALLLLERMGGGGMEARFTRGKSALLERALARPRTEVSLSAFALLFSELVQHCQSRVFSVAELQARLAALGRQVGARVLDALVAREKGARRETKVLGALLFVKGAVWKALFGKEADKLEQANDDARTFYIIEREPLSSHLYLGAQGEQHAQLRQLHGGHRGGGAHAQWLPRQGHGALAQGHYAHDQVRGGGHRPRPGPGGPLTPRR